MRRLRITGLFICAIGFVLLAYELFLQYFENVKTNSTLSAYSIYGIALAVSGAFLFRLIKEPKIKQNPS